MIIWYSHEPYSNTPTFCRSPYSWLSPAIPQAAPVFEQGSCEYQIIIYRFDEAVWHVRAAFFYLLKILCYKVWNLLRKRTSLILGYFSHRYFAWSIKLSFLIIILENLFRWRKMPLFIGFFRKIWINFGVAIQKNMKEST